MEKILRKSIILVVFYVSLSLNANTVVQNNCKYYYNQSIQYQHNARFQPTQELHNRFKHISNNYWRQYQECLKASHFNRPYRGSR